MRLPLTDMLNGVAWAILIGLIAVAFVLVIILGPFGLVLLGLLTLFVCTSASLREDTPAWGPDVFEARFGAHRSPEQRAADAEDRRQALKPLTFFRWCAAVLLVAGIAGFTWQLYR